MASKADFDKLSIQLAAQINELKPEIKQISELKSEIKQVKELIGMQSTDFKELTVELRQRMDAIQADISEANKSIEQLFSRVVDLEKSSRANNLIVYGLEEKKDEKLLEKMEDFLRGELQISEHKIPDSPFEAVFRLGKQSAQAKKKKTFRPILVKFESRKFRNLVLGEAKNLKEVNEAQSTKLGISPDLPREMRSATARFADQIKEARNQKKKLRWVGSKLLAGDEVICDVVDEFPAEDNDGGKAPRLPDSRTLRSASGRGSASSKSGN